MSEIIAVILIYIAYFSLVTWNCVKSLLIKKRGELFRGKIIDCEKKLISARFPKKVTVQFRYMSEDLRIECPARIVGSSKIGEEVLFYYYDKYPKTLIIADYNYLLWHIIYLVGGTLGIIACSHNTFYS